MDPRRLRARCRRRGSRRAAGARSPTATRPPRNRRAALLGPAVASYTARADRRHRRPAWHEGHRELPFVFVGSAASAAAGLGAARRAPGPDRAARGAWRCSAPSPRSRRRSCWSVASGSSPRPTSRTRGQADERRRGAHRRRGRGRPVTSASQPPRGGALRRRAAGRLRVRSLRDLRGRHGSPRATPSTQSCLSANAAEPHSRAARVTHQLPPAMATADSPLTRRRFPPNRWD